MTTKLTAKQGRSLARQPRKAAVAPALEQLRQLRRCEEDETTTVGCRPAAPATDERVPALMETRRLTDSEFSGDAGGKH